MPTPKPWTTRNPSLTPPASSPHRTRDLPGRALRVQPRGTKSFEHSHPEPMSTFWLVKAPRASPRSTTLARILHLAQRQRRGTFGALQRHARDMSWAQPWWSEQLCWAQMAGGGAGCCLDGVTGAATGRGTICGISGGRGRSLFHVDEDLVATQEPGLERRVEPGKARCADRSQTCRGDGVEKFRAVTLVRRLRPATAIFLRGRETSWYRADLDIRVGRCRCGVGGQGGGQDKAIT